MFIVKFFLQNKIAHMLTICHKQKKILPNVLKLWTWAIADAKQIYDIACGMYTAASISGSGKLYKPI
jgi:hypothetical protein